MKTNTRPRVVRLAELGSAARAGVALAVDERGKRAAALAPTASLEPIFIGIIFDPDPAPVGPLGPDTPTLPE